jgi:Concanavalin A-like lectin/glucanases superfamily
MFAYTKIMQGIQAVSAVVTDAYFNLVTLLLPGNGTNGAQNNTFLDSSSNNFTITRNGNTTQGTFSPFSQTGWSNFFDGNGDYLSLASNAVLAPGTGDFTIEAWLYPTATLSTYNSVFETSATNGLLFGKITSGYGIRAAGTADLVAATAPAINEWVHVAATRSGTSLRVFINGVLSATVTNSTNFATGIVTIGASNAGTNSFPGYISNLRFVKGTALYTADFTPSTTPLTAVTNTQLLTCQSNRFLDNSSNALTLTRNNDVSVQAFSPFAPTAAYSAATNGGSGYFDGAGDFLVLADNVALEPGNGDFTWEAWAYLPNNTSDYSLYAGTSNGDLDIRRFSDGTLRIGRINTAWDSTSSAMSIANQWAHLAISRSGSTLRMFLNGAQIFSGTNSNNYFVTTSAVVGNTQSAQYVSGYLSGYRLVKGTALYTAAFTPPTAPPTAITNTSLLLNFTNGGIIDATGKNVLETVGNAQISTAQSKWGGSSMYFDGTGDYLFSPVGQNYSFPGDFTIECWINTSTTSTEGGAYRRLFATGPDNAASLQIVFSDGSTASGSISVVTSTFVISGNINAATGAWVHVALARSGTSMKLFVGGVQSGSTATTSQAFTNGATYGLYVASSQAGTGRYLGYIQDFRITKGYARYTTAFTPPSAAFPVQ